jgi:2'-hydroxyisoflavone reductase
LILGPHDYDPRFAWWLRRIAKGGDVLAPGDPNAPVQVVDVRDLAAWMVTTNATGPFNVTGKPTSMRELFDTMRRITASNARFVWVPDELLLKHDVKPYSEMPFWLPASLGARVVPIDRALDSALTLRPIEETARDTWAWLQTEWASEGSVRENRRMRIPAGISEERERLILEQAS